jgi:two-component system cell cycle response regulator
LTLKQALDRNKEDKTMIHKDRVLIVDDQPMNVRIMSACLEKAGYEVFKAYDGASALRISSESKPDVILLDVMMPEMDGFEVAEQLRKSPETNIIPIILVTALGETKDSVRGLNSGADDFLTKPVKLVELLARVRSLIKLKRLHEEVKATTDLSSHSIDDVVDVRREKSIILIVEDDEIAAKICEQILGTAGFETIIAATAQEAEDLLNKTAPDLILLDLMLPDRSGLELLGILRREPEFENVPIIITSAIADLEMRVKGIDSGADDYLVKPVNSLELVARVKSNIHKYEVQQRLKRNADKLFILSMTDQLTGLYNRQYLKTVLEREIAASKRYGAVFSLLLLDIDHFKDINDVCGHLAGDSVLRELGQLLPGSIREIDVAARYGGDEFIVLLINSAADAAVAVAEKLRQSVECFGFAHVKDMSVTISIGVTEGHVTDDGLESVLKRADEALYAAKRNGRNRVATDKELI